LEGAVEVPELRGPEDYQRYIQEVVEKVPGALAASIVGVDGISLAGYSPIANFDFGLVDAELASVQRAAHSATGGMSAGSVEEIVVVSEKATFQMRPAGKEFYITISLRSDQTLGVARLVAKKLAADIAGLFDS
jgi:predicted regulator of Ras-like GTPase activity (Roadblock/LC7/MglB family)